MMKKAIILSTTLLIAGVSALPEVLVNNDDIVATSTTPTTSGVITTTTNNNSLLITDSSGSATQNSSSNVPCTSVVDQDQTITPCAGGASPCDCADGVDELECPCLWAALELQEANPLANIKAIYNENTVNVNNVHSTHNSVVVNHLHVDTTVTYPDGTQEKLSSLLPSTLVDLGCTGTGGLGINDPTAFTNDIASALKDRLQSLYDLTRATATSTTKAANSSTNAARNTVQSGLQGMTNSIIKTIGGTTGTGGGTNLSSSSPVQQRIILANEKSPLSTSALTSLRSFLSSSLGSAGTISLLSQSPLSGFGSTDTNSGYAVTYQVTSQNGTFEETKGAVDKITSSSSFLSSLQNLFGSGASVEPALSVAASNETCIQGNCTENCQCDLYFSCTKNSQCLSNSCDNSSQLCVHTSTSSASTVAIMGALFALVIAFF